MSLRYAVIDLLSSKYNVKLKRVIKFLKLDTFWVIYTQTRTTRGQTSLLFQYSIQLPPMP